MGARTTGRRILSVPPRTGRPPLLLVTVVGRGKPRPLSTLLPPPLDPPRSTMPSLASILLGLHPATLPRPNSTSSRRRLTSLPGVDFFLSIFSSLSDQRQERSIVVEACP